MSGEWDNQFRIVGCVFGAGIAALVAIAFGIGWWLRG
jgi:uncharacterized membrane protein YgaE (UPF0421/DUF939 family)